MKLNSEMRHSGRPIASVTAWCFYLLMICLISGNEQQAEACSAVSSGPKNGSFFLGANFDWKARGGIVYLSPRGQKKSAVLTGFGSRVPQGEMSRSRELKTEAAMWVSRFASLTISQFGRDYPMQGINEKGLAGLVLMAPADYPKSGKIATITENLWLQHQLDRYSSVTEVENHVLDFGFETVSANLHWFFCDASGECATIEFRQGRPFVYRGKVDLYKTLTNSSFHESWSYFLDWKKSRRALPQGYGSLARFTRLAASLEYQDEMDIEVALNDVALAGFTAWQSIFNLNEKSFSIRLEGGDWMDVSFKGHNLYCRDDLPMLNLAEESWSRYSSEVVQLLLQNALDGLSGEEARRIMRVVRGSENVSCRQ